MDSSARPAGSPSSISAEARSRWASAARSASPLEIAAANISAMMGSRCAAVPGRHMASWSASFATAIARGITCCGGEVDRPGPPSGSSRPSGARIVPCRISRASAAATRDCRANDPSRSPSSRAAACRRSSTSTLSPPDRCPSACSPRAACASVAASPRARAVTAASRYRSPACSELSGPFQRRRQLEQQGEALIDARLGPEPVEDMQCTQVVHAGGVVAEPCRCHPCGTDRVVDRVLPCLRSGRDEVRGDPRRVGRASLQRPTHREVDLGAGRRAQAVENGLPIQVVGESGSAAGDFDDTGAARFLQHLVGVGLGSRRTALRQQAQVDVPAGDRSPVRAAGHTRSTAGPTCGEVSRRCWPGCAPWSCELPCATSNPGQLADEEGVAPAPAPDLAAHPLGHGRAGDPGDHRLDVRRIEGRERAAAAREPASSTELVGRLHVPVGAEQQHPARRQRPGQEPEQPQRRLVRPLQIVEDDQQRPPAGQGLQGRGRPTRTAGTAHPRQ